MSRKLRPRKLRPQTSDPEKSDPKNSLMARIERSYKFYKFYDFSFQLHMYQNLRFFVKLYNKFYDFSKLHSILDITAKTQTPETQTPKTQTPKIKKKNLKMKLNSSSVELLYGHAMFTDNSHNGGLWGEIFVSSSLSLSHALIKQ